MHLQDNRGIQQTHIHTAFMATLQRWARKSHETRAAQWTGQSSPHRRETNGHNAVSECQNPRQLNHQTRQSMFAANRRLSKKK